MGVIFIFSFSNCILSLVIPVMILRLAKLTADFVCCCCATQSVRFVVGIDVKGL
jgi:hypothetical protein